MSAVVLGPRLEGQFGWAQQVTVPDDPHAAVQIGTWIMYLPNQGVGWSHFMLVVMSLKDLPGMRPAFRRYPHAEYELLVQAMESDPEPDVSDPRSWIPLQPVNVVVQFHGINPRRAFQVGESAAWWCVRGRLPAETQMFVRTTAGQEKMMTIKQAVDLWEQSVQMLVQQARRGRIPGRDS